MTLFGVASSDLLGPCLDVPPIGQGSSSDFLHGPRSWRWERLSLSGEMLDDLFDSAAEIFIERDRIVSVNPRDQIRAAADVGMVFIAPFYPFVVAVTRLHCLQLS